MRRQRTLVILVTSLGYRIAEAYYAKQTDKAAALRDIIRITDAEDFLARSGYSP